MTRGFPRGALLVLMLALSFGMMSSAEPSNESAGTFQLSVSKTSDYSQNHVAIDDQYRIIGETNNFDIPNCRQTKVLPTMKFPFVIQENKATMGQPMLVIGSIRGINTRKAHIAGQSHSTYISSPVVIKLNGIRISYVYMNGENIAVNVPSGVLNPGGVNVLQIESGYYFPEENQIAYDNVQFKDINLNL